MDKVKIQEIADEAGLSNGDLLDKAKKLGFNVSAPNSTISMEEAGILVDYAISGTLPRNWKKIQNKKSKRSRKSSTGSTYKTPEKTKWAGITIVGEKAITDIAETEKTSQQKKQPSKKAQSAATSRKKKRTKNSDTSEASEKLLDSYENLRLEGIQKNVVDVTLNRNYTPSEKIAIKKGFEEVVDPNAYNGRYFIKDQKIWIHDIGALKARLGVLTDHELRSHGYDVDTYYATNKYESKSSNVRPLRICDTKDGNDQCHYSLDDMVYMSDGMYIHKDDCWW